MKPRRVKCGYKTSAILKQLWWGALTPEVESFEEPKTENLMRCRPFFRDRGKAP